MSTRWRCRQISPTLTEASNNSVLYETLRLYPPVHSIPKSVAEDTTLTVGNSSGEKTTIILPHGSSISIHTPGLHYNRTSFCAHPFRDLVLVSHPARFAQRDTGKTPTPSTPSGSSTQVGRGTRSCRSAQARARASVGGSQRRSR